MIKFLESILVSDEVSSLIRENEEGLFSFIPELGLCKGFNQNNEWHIYDVYDHTLALAKAQQLFSPISGVIPQRIVYPPTTWDTSIISH